MASARRVIVTGATGLIGRTLCQQLRLQGYEVIVFSRSPDRARSSVPGAAAYIAWEPAEDGAWAAAVDGAEAVIHLAGAPLTAHRWTDAYKREIVNSRKLGARGLVNAIARAQSRPRVFLSASGVDYYGPRGDTVIDESQPPGSGFISQVCIEWEREAFRAETLGVRVAVIRTGLVLDKHEGALSELLVPFTFFVGGPILPSTQWWSWIHLADEIGLFMMALDDERARGAFNGTAPEPVRNREFCETLGRVLRRPSWFPVPFIALELLLGEMAAPLLIEKQRAIPKKALDLGFQFKYPTLEPALRQILAK